MLSEENCSLGFVETAGLSAAIQVADAMAKAAEVTVFRAHKVDGLRVAVICRGDVGSCQAAVDTGAELARSIDALICANVIPSPADNAGVLNAMLLEIPAKKAARKKAKQARMAAAKAEWARREAEENGELPQPTGEDKAQAKKASAKKAPSDK